MTANKPAWTSESLQAPHDVADKAHRVRRMFNAIAPCYELVNSLFSVGRDAVWRRRAVQLAATCGDDLVLDIACGTGDFARAFTEANPQAVVGCDFAHSMLTLAAGRGNTSARWCEADALRLPFKAESFTITSCAFGVRNFDDLDAGLTEMYRVLRPGGRTVILEFTRPANRFVRRLYELYANHLMPAAASLISGDRSGAYRYLPRSVVLFQDVEQMCVKLKQAGFARVTVTPLTLGVVTVYVGLRD
ncbi:MAG: bifunctional demethylmenaquinone methyltransferase/2-methoxy-6-polyprenyl-1,4-benzoquinol methylase UbiE [Phycisphaerales bacterium]|nr:MAG: bifunctional demethylmenaquinone methyltransferase/2-methoxy-6-polyprenyl-1,4-benzoquinol methylase UbiE [Phycisphaerales bacterium]